MAKKSYLLFSLLVASPSLLAASFDCAKAGTPVEKMICADERISKLDSDLSDAYKGALDKVDNKDQFKQEQLKWLKNRNLCTDANCLAKAYQERISTLSNSAQANSTPAESKSVSSQSGMKHAVPLKFKLAFGDSYPICQPYIDMLNAAQYREYPACERKLLPEFSQFKELKWTEITDKDEMKKIKTEQLEIEAIQWNRLDKPMHQIALKEQMERIESGRVRMFYSQMDIGADGDVEIIYKESEPYRAARSVVDCDTSTYFYVHDEKITTSNAKEFIGSPYNNLSMNSLNQLFVFDKYVYSSSWSKLIDNYDIYIWGSNPENKYTKLHQPVCGIKIQ